MHSHAGAWERGLSMQIQLPLAEYQFTYQAIDPITMPELNGTLWHSVLGNALRKLSCSNQQHPCNKNCRKPQNCDYSQLFCGVPSESSALLTHANKIPPPHLFRSERQCYEIKATQTFHIQLILIGDANQKLPLFINAMRLVGENGFHRDRCKAQLIQVIQKTPYGIQRSILIKNHPQQTGLAMPYPVLQPLQTVRIDFKTPFRQTGKAAKNPNFLLDRFLMALIRRISQMQYFYAEEKPQDNYSQLKQLTESIPILNQTMRHLKYPALTHRKNQHQQSKGWIGYIDIDLSQHQALWVYLYLGQWLNAGKNASMGFGQYQLIDLGGIS